MTVNFALSFAGKDRIMLQTQSSIPSLTMLFVNFAYFSISGFSECMGKKISGYKDVRIQPPVQ